MTKLLLPLAFSTLFFKQLFSQHQVSTFAGSSQGYVDASLTSSKFTAPTGFCVSASGNEIYLADYSGNRIRKINKVTNQVSTVAGTGVAGFQDGASANAKFYYPAGLALSSDGAFLYVADNGNSLIRKIDLATNNVTTIAGDGDFAHSDNANGLMAKFNQPTDLLLQGDSVLFISDTENHVLRKMNLQTSSVTTVVGIAGVGGFLDGVGTSAAIKNPSGISFSSDGTAIFLADKGNHKIRKILLSNFLVSSLAGDGSQGFMDGTNGLTAKFYSPQGVSVDPTNPDVLFVADTYNHRIRKVNLTTSEVSTIAGDGSVPPASTFANNSNGMLAKFFYPTACVVSPDGQNIYVADQGNFKIRSVKTDNLNTSGLEETEGDNISVYPNPTSSSIELKNKHLSYDKLIVCDLTGKELLTFNQDQEITLENLSNGIYVLKLVENNQSIFVTEKIIKE